MSEADSATGSGQGLSRREFLVAAVLLLFLPLVAIAQSQQADLILLHGQVLTVDAHDSLAQAIAVRRGVILNVGSDAKVQALDAAGWRGGISGGGFGLERLE